MSWDFAAKYAVHDRHIKEDLLEYLGPEIENISFTMHFSAYLGLSPLEEIENLRKIVKEGRAERLVIGGRIYGSHKWVIEKVAAGLQRFDKVGTLLAAEANVTLKEYPKR